jgi:hypothetical protein
MTSKAENDTQLGSVNYPGRAKKPQIDLRQPSNVETPDIEKQPLKYIALALVHLKNVIARLPVMIEDNSRPVDEYQPQTLSAESEVTITVQPQWEDPEIIRSVLVTGPAASVINIQLGDRNWALTIPATGFIVISPLWLLLSRNDVRILTSVTPGQYTFELMGHADTRGNLV